MPLRVDRIRGVLYILLLAGMFLGGFEPFFLRMLFADREAASRELTEAPDRGAPGYAAFLRSVMERTPPDARIAIFVPMRQWSGGYDYAYYRASYVLAPREIIPLVDPDDQAHLERLARADYVAAWRMVPEFDGFVPIWGEDGSAILMRRDR